MTNKKGKDLKEKAPEKTVEKIDHSVHGLGNIAQSIADIMYFERRQLGEVTDEQQKQLLADARWVLNCIDKLNLMIVPIRDLRAERLKDKNELREIIHCFLEGINKPKDLAKDFPIDELVERIIDGRKV